MTKKTQATSKKRMGIWIYTSEELKRRVNRARRHTGQTITGLVTQALLRQLDRIEADLRRRKLL